MGRWVYIDNKGYDKFNLISNTMTWCDKNVTKGYYSPLTRAYNLDLKRFMDAVYFFNDDDYTLYLLIRDSL